MSKLRTFSEKITTGRKAVSKPALRSSKSFFRNYQEVEVAMGPSEWKILLKQIKEWKKRGGTLKAKLKGTKKEVKLGVSKIDTSEVDKQLKQKVDRMLRDWGSGLPMYKKLFREGMQRAWEQSIPLKCVNDALIAWEHGHPFKSDQLECLMYAFPELRDAIDFPEDYGERNPRVPQGDNYHSSIGWY